MFVAKLKTTNYKLLDAISFLFSTFIKNKAEILLILLQHIRWCSLT